MESMPTHIVIPAKAGMTKEEMGPSERDLPWPRGPQNVLMNISARQVTDLFRAADARVCASVATDVQSSGLDGRRAHSGRPAMSTYIGN
jgi:hypothetical protein